MFNKNYELYKVEKPVNFRVMIENSAQKYADRVAFRFTVDKQDKTVTFKQHLDNVRYLGTAIANQGIHNQKIALVGDNSYDWILTQITVLSTNNTLVPIDKELPLKDLLNVINHSDSSVVFCTSNFAKCLIENRSMIPNVTSIICFRPKELIEGVIDAEAFIDEGKKLFESGNRAFLDTELDENMVGEIVYTSGTTGAPKGVMLTKHNLLSLVYYGLQIMTVYDTGLSVLPYNHTYESTCNLLVCQHYGATTCINENLKTVALNFKKYNPDYAMLVPLFVENFYKKILKALEKENKKEKLFTLIKVSNFLRKLGIDLRTSLFRKVREIFGTNFKMIVCGGAPIRSEVAYFFDGIGILLINGYGITECSPLVSVNRERYNDYRSVGVKLPCIEVKIDNPNEQGEGEIVVKGDTVMKGYYKEPLKTAEVLSQDGWFATGDYGKLVGDRLYITGRKKNLIVLQNGKNVYPEEIEEYIQGIDGVCEVVVYAQKDSDGNETAILAEIYPDMDFAKDKSDEELTDYFMSSIDLVTKQLPGYKHIQKVILRKEEFPKTTSRKIRRVGLGQN